LSLVVADSAAIAGTAQNFIAKCGLITDWFMVSKGSRQF